MLLLSHRAQCWGTPLKYLYYNGLDESTKGILSQFADDSELVFFCVDLLEGRKALDRLD